MKISTICFCLKEDLILLAMKKCGFGAGKLNGYGGKKDGDEAPQETAIRELKEESGLIAKEDDLEQVAIIRFYFEGDQLFECYIFFLKSWEGEPLETDEMSPQWFSVTDIPFKAMWVDDELWLPLVLGGKKIDANIDLNADGSAVRSFSWKEASFT